MNYQIIKKDKIGRQYIKESEQILLVSEYKRSSLSMKKFCIEKGLNPSSFKNWLYKKSKISKEVNFTEVLCEELPKNRKINIVLENKIEVAMNIENSKELISLIKELKIC